MNEDNRVERFKAIAIVVIFFFILPSPALHSYVGIESKPTFVASVFGSSPESVG
jgi:hypothetical protein